jgi:HSP20 family molecular chaperone IbpA
LEEASSIWESITSGQFYDVFRLPGEADGDLARAKYDCGILTATLPRVVLHEGSTEAHVLT